MDKNTGTNIKVETEEKMTLEEKLEKFTENTWCGDNACLIQSKTADK